MNSTAVAVYTYMYVCLPSTMHTVANMAQEGSEGIAKAMVSSEACVLENTNIPVDLFKDASVWK